MREELLGVKTRLTSAPILTLPEGAEGFVIYCDASKIGLGEVLMQVDKAIAYALRQLKDDYMSLLVIQIYQVYEFIYI